MGERFFEIQWAELFALVAFSLLCLNVVLAPLALLKRESTKLLVAIRATFFSSTVFIGLATLGLVIAFLVGDYRVRFVYYSSSEHLSTLFKLGGILSGYQGVTLASSLIIGLLGSVVIFRGIRRESQLSSPPQFETAFILCFALVQLFLVTLVVWVASPFELLSEAEQRFFSREGDGSGLNPIIHNSWFLIHVLSVIVARAFFVLAFALGVTVLATNVRDGWLPSARRWVMTGWALQSLGIATGGFWSYEVLGWGGYWAWDPIQSSSLIVWLAALAFLHVSRVSTAWGKHRWWCSLFAVLPFTLGLLSTTLQRSGIVNSVHASGRELGDFYIAFLLVVTCTIVFLLSARRSPRDPADRRMLGEEFASIWLSRVLLGMASALVVLLLWPWLTKDLVGDAVQPGVPIYNQVMTPFWCVVLLGMGMTFLLGRGAIDHRTIRNRVLSSALFALPLAFLVQGVAMMVRGDGAAPLSGTTLLISMAANASAAFLLVATLPPLIRGGAGSFLGRGECLASFGVAVLALGVVQSSFCRVWSSGDFEEGLTSGPYSLELVEERENLEDPAYSIQAIDLNLSRGTESLATLRPERRFHKSREQMVTDVSIHSPALQDFYAFYTSTPDGSGSVTLSRIPFMSLVRLGALLLVLGGLWAAGRRPPFGAA